MNLDKQKIMLSAFITCLAALAGCTVKTASVPNHPPVIEGNTNRYEKADEFAAFHFPDKTSGISIFLWPAGLSEEQARTKVRAVNKAAADYDAVLEEADKSNAAEKESENNFYDKKCIDRFAVDPTNVDKVEEWKKVEPTDPDYALFLQCHKWQDDMQNSRVVNDKNSRKVDDALDVLFKEVDSTYPAVQTNWKNVDKDNSALTISEAVTGQSVELTLADFEFKGNTLSTALADGDPRKIRKAYYDKNSKVLMFEFNEMTAAGQPTGNVYQFLLERSSNFLKRSDSAGYARFKGDLSLVSASGQLLRNGSAQIQGLK